MRLRPSNLHSIAAGMASLTGFFDAFAVFWLAAAAAAVSSCEVTYVGGSTPTMPVDVGVDTDVEGCASADISGATPIDDVGAEGAGRAAAATDGFEAAEGSGSEAAEASDAGGLAQAAVIAAADEAGTVLSNAPSTTTRVP